MNCSNGVLEATTTTQIPNNISNIVDSSITTRYHSSRPSAFTATNIREHNRRHYTASSPYPTAAAARSPLYSSILGVTNNSNGHHRGPISVVTRSTVNSRSDQLSPLRVQLSSPGSSSLSEGEQQSSAASNQWSPVQQDSLMENLQKFFDSQQQERTLVEQQERVAGPSKKSDNDRDIGHHHDGPSTSGCASDGGCAAGGKQSTSSIDNLPPSLDGCLQFQQRSVIVPFMLQSDFKYSSLKSTRVLDQLISCFVVGGECRLCLPQMLVLVLPAVTQRRVDEACVRLRVSNMQANKEQLQILKAAGALPASATNCELITKSNAERLIAQFVDGGREVPLDELACRQLDSLPVAHDCFGGCAGRLYAELAPRPCIECATCGFLFHPENFCRHSHADGAPNADDRKCHWGFDASNWPFYLHVDDEYAPHHSNEPSVGEAETRLAEFVQSVQSRQQREDEQHQQQQLVSHAT